ncbi:DUF2306 domain-containing protein [Paenibacillus wulumuqiensis]|uniref:DUF2306 domain-containing protein n=1 Tax=Paenibacillus wulumuqiensis TaxID=1567107 RepID=UPI0006195B24|nr:DUF2306 domain-containing protein [Paenibacillus wulumuqiensis]
MNKSIRQLLYVLLLAFALIYTLYTLYLNLLLDPVAADFLVHKTELKRPLNVPLWLNMMYIHVIAACWAMVGGALNFSLYLLRRYRRWHRINGYLYIAAVLVVDLTSGYLAPYATGGKITSIPFNLVNIAWLWVTITALIQIKRGNLFRHRRWMVRSYVFCFTNMFIHGISLIGQHLFGLEFTLSYIIGVYGAIVVNIAVAELINRTIFRHPVETL